MFLHEPHYLRLYETLSLLIIDMSYQIIRSQTSQLSRSTFRHALK